MPSTIANTIAAMPKRGSTLDSSSAVSLRAGASLCPTVVEKSSGSDCFIFELFWSAGLCQFRQCAWSPNPWPAATRPSFITLRGQKPICFWIAIGSEWKRVVTVEPSVVTVTSIVSRTYFDHTSCSLFLTVHAVSYAGCFRLSRNCKRSNHGKRKETF